MLILLNAVQIAMKASHELLDHNLDAKALEAVRVAANRVPGVSVAAVSGREHGSDVLVELNTNHVARLRTKLR